MVMIMDERTKRKFKLAQIQLQKAGQFNPELRKVKSAKRLRKEARGNRSRNVENLSNSY